MLGDMERTQRRYEGGAEEELLAALRAKILEMLTPEQGRALRRR
jgi:hypothetical protein